MSKLLCNVLKISGVGHLLRACFVPCLPFRVHVAGDPNEKLPFIASVLSTSFARALEQMEISMSPNDVFDLESPLN